MNNLIIIAVIALTGLNAAPIDVCTKTMNDVTEARKEALAYSDAGLYLKAKISMTTALKAGKKLKKDCDFLSPMMHEKFDKANEIMSKDIKDYDKQIEKGKI